MRFATVVATALLLLLGAGRAAEPAPGLDPAPVLAGRWVNEKGSEMLLEIADAGSVTGRYRSAVGRVSADDWYPLTGVAAGDQVGFCVSWARPSGNARPASSVTCMVGEHTRGDRGEQLHLTWLLERNVPDAREETELWSAVSTGSSVYHRPETAPVER